MQKNIVWILLIFIVPLTTYYWLTRDKLVSLPAIASGGDTIIKFSSPMCYECQELEKVILEVFPKYENKITLHEVDVTQKDKNCKKLIQEYNVKLVPTTIFKNQDGRIVRRVEGTIQPKILDNYLVELINE